MARTLILDCNNKVGETVTIQGWVQTRRDHGKIAFVDLRDRSAIIQIFMTGEQVGDLSTEDVVEVTGKVNKRPEKLINDKIPTGEIELSAESVTILNKSQTPPFPLDEDGYSIDDDLRLKYRYLDLRRERLAKNIALRHQLILFIRNWLSEKGFYEVETPILTKSTPEGARDFLVPSRHHSGKFYALPQSPQQYKQLLMIAGVEKYFQIARCFRDEDTRKDRQLEFTQLDLEMSFVEREDVMQLNEALLIDLVKTIAPEKKIQQIPFPRITYKEAMEKYKSDRPDIRENKDDPNLLAFCWVIDFPFFEKDDEGGWTFTHNPFSASMPESHQNLMDQKNIGEIIASQYDIVLNGYEIGGGSIRSHRPEELQTVFEILGFEKDAIQKEFGHMMEAFSFGAPPHGGIAWGLDRLVSLLANEPTIREVIAFPTSSFGNTAVMDAPSEVSDKQLKEVGLKIDTSKK